MLRPRLVKMVRNNPWGWSLALSLQDDITGLEGSVISDGPEQGSPVSLHHLTSPEALSQKVVRPRQCDRPTSLTGKHVHCEGAMSLTSSVKAHFTDPGIPPSEVGTDYTGGMLPGKETPPTSGTHTCAYAPYCRASSPNSQEIPQYHLIHVCCLATLRDLGVMCVITEPAPREAWQGNYIYVCTPNVGKVKRFLK